MQCMYTLFIYLAPSFDAEPPVVVVEEPPVNVGRSPIPSKTIHCFFQFFCNYTDAKVRDQTF